MVVMVPVRAHGPFGFSRKYDERQVLDLLSAAMVWNTTVGTLPILPAWAAKLNEDLIVRSIFGTAAIEGSPLTEPEVSALLAAGAGPAVKTAKEQVILNLREAYRAAGVGQARNVVTDKPFSEERIRELHELIARDLDHDRYLPGTYRFGPVEVGDAEHGGKYRPPKVPADVGMLMSRFVQWLNSAELRTPQTAVVRAFLAHYHLALIHPFKDGNGRLARVVEAEMLAAAGYHYAPLMMSNYYYENIDDYYRAFSKAEQNDFDLTPFLVFCLDGLVRSLTDIHFRVTDQIRRLALRKHYDDLRRERSLSQRQHGLLLLLLDRASSFTQAGLKSESGFAAWYEWVSVRTMQRDLEKLLRLQLISQPAPGTYELNLKALG